jgi:pimeloyl-ACP methyl ester carboxylesterase
MNCGEFTVELKSILKNSESTKANLTVNSFLEARFPLELMALPYFFPLLQSAPMGDGHPVLTLPGFSASDSSTYVMRQFLANRGYRSYAWNLGRNIGPLAGLETRMVDRVKALTDQHGEAVSLVGWSLGGLFSRFIGNEIPDHVRTVITLGSPIGISEGGENLSPLVLRLADGVMPNRLKAMFSQANLDHWRDTPPVPTTAVYSMTDGAAHWKNLCDPLQQPRSENVRVPGTHTGMTHNPFVYWILANRLAQEPGEWRPYRSSGVEAVLRTLSQPFKRIW